MTFRDIVLNESMVKVLIWDTDKSKYPEDRIIPRKQAHILGQDDNSYRVQILGKDDKVDFEYKRGVLI